jgi:dihydrolipoamide dehydrogenase
LGSFVDATHVAVAKADGTTETIEAKHHYCYRFKTSSLPFIKIDKERNHFYRSFELKEVPKHLVIIGGGVIGIELGQVYIYDWERKFLL